MAGFAITCSLLYVFRVAGFEFLNRYAFFTAFFAQAVVADMATLAVEAFLLKTSTAQRFIHDTVSRISVIAFVIGLVVVAWATPILRSEKLAGRPLSSFTELMRMPSTHESYYAQMQALAMYVTPEDIAIMPVTHDTFKLASIVGTRVVLSPFAFLVPDQVQRARDIDEFFDVKTTSMQRVKIMRRYGVTVIILPANNFKGSEFLSNEFGPPLIVDGYALFRPDTL